MREIDASLNSSAAQLVNDTGFQYAIAEPAAKGFAT